MLERNTFLAGQRDKKVFTNSTSRPGSLHRFLSEGFPRSVHGKVRRAAHLFLQSSRTLIPSVLYLDKDWSTGYVIGSHIVYRGQ